MQGVFRVWLPCKSLLIGLIDGLQSRDETAMLVDKTIANYGSYFA